MSDSDRADEEFSPCANCGTLIDLADFHSTVIVERSVTADETERVTLHFCSDDCLEEWTGPLPE
ncbi:DUF7576 family protein [Haladaptatus halobius]|uniref:DUF7576 family protein n=1 Tax=Haladaptatus halobius TaxID=2884875 RepID=UPI001D0BBFD4|nr:hypothetical protein [Haladaptatus halobius]